MAINELICKRSIEGSNYESAETKARRQYLWDRMSDAVFNEEPIKFYSTQMKKFYLPPQTKNYLERKKEEHEMTGKAGRLEVPMRLENRNFEMVVPDTFEKEKWNPVSKEEEMARKLII